MTKAIKPIARETFSTVRERGNVRPIIVEIHPTFIRVRLKNCRIAFTITINQLYTLGAKNQVAATRAEREAAKKERRLPK